MFGHVSTLKLNLIVSLFIRFDMKIEAMCIKKSLEKHRDSICTCNKEEKMFCVIQNWTPSLWKMNLLEDWKITPLSMKLKELGEEWKYLFIVSHDSSSTKSRTNGSKSKDEI